MPRAKWKIYYTDGTSLRAHEVDRVRDIPAAKRIGVHSVVQAIDGDRMRDTLVGAAFYTFLKTPRAWCQMEQNDVDDYNANSPGEIIVKLTGRIQTTEDYQRMLRATRFDDDVIGRIHDPNLRDALQLRRRREE